MKKTLLLLCFILVISLIGCKNSKSEKQENEDNYQDSYSSITQLNKYKILLDDPISISINFNDEYQGSFIIDDNNDLLYIMNYIRTTPIIKINSYPAPGTNRYMIFTYVEDSISVKTNYIAMDNIYFAFNGDKSKEIDSYLQNIGLSKNSITIK